MRLTDIFAREIYAARLRKGLSQESLAAKAGISISYVSMLERGLRSPPFDTIELLAKALGVTPLSLLDGSRRAR